jgi:hypothetical protein
MGGGGRVTKGSRIDPGKGLADICNFPAKPIPVSGFMQ